MQNEKASQDGYLHALRISPYLPRPHGAKEAAVVSVLLVELHADIDELKEWKQALLLSRPRAKGFIMSRMKTQGR